MLVGNYNLPSLDATGLDVIIIGGGDTGVDCIGTSLRQVYLTAVSFKTRSSAKIQNFHTSVQLSQRMVCARLVGHRLPAGRVENKFSSYARCS